MKQHFNSRLIRLITVICIIFSVCFLFNYLLQLEQRNTLLKEQEQDAALRAVMQAKEQEKLVLAELSKQAENDRIARIMASRIVLEPELDLENTADLNNKYYIAVPTPVEPWTDATLQLLKSPMGQQFQADLFTIPEDMPDFKQLTTQERVFKSLFQYLDPIIADGVIDVTKDARYKQVWQIYSQLETNLFPWIQPYWDTLFDISNEEESKGIVMCVGNGQFKYAATSVQAIREILKSDIAIEIFYIDEYDLSQEKRDYFDAMDNVKTIDISTRINNAYTKFGGWSLKPYAILASSFSQVMLMDADVFMFQKPEFFFEDEGFKRTGALFFLDRTLFDNFEQGKKWLKSFLPTYSSYVTQARWWKTTSTHEQESGIVLVDKRKTLFGLLATCKMNDKNERDQVSYQHSHGDKETFWIGYEMIQAPYAFIKSVGAVIGGLGDAGAEDTVCGNQLHLDTEGRPLWWNGGLLRDKNRWENRYMKFTHFAQGEKWQFETSCIKEKDKIQELTTAEQKIGAQLISMDKKRKKEQEGTDLVNDEEW